MTISREMIEALGGSLELTSEEDGGTRVTETWTRNRGYPRPVAAVVDRIATGRPSFAEYQQWNIRKSLDRLRDLFSDDA